MPIPNFILAFWMLLVQSGAVPPLNSTAVDVGCTSNTTCVYIDVNVPPGPHFYFAVAANANGYSDPSNRVDVVVPSGSHNVNLSWTPSAPFDPTVGYFIYRGAPPSGLKITGSN